MQFEMQEWGPRAPYSQGLLPCLELLWPSRPLTDPSWRPSCRADRCNVAPCSHYCSSGQEILQLCVFENRNAGAILCFSLLSWIGQLLALRLTTTSCIERWSSKILCFEFANIVLIVCPIGCQSDCDDPVEVLATPCLFAVVLPAGASVA